MKTVLTLLLVTALGTPILVAQSRSISGMRDVAGHDELSQKLRMAQQADPIRDLGPPTGNTEEDPSLKVTKRDLLASSTVFSYRGHMTLVPKRSVLHIPETLESRLQVTKGSKVQKWQDFYQANRGWIRVLEVTREQAMGHKPFSEETAAAISDSSQIVVATFRGGPISVLPLQEEESVPEASEMKPVTFR